MKKIPFYPNSSDDLHCFQASLRMILKYFLPSEEYDYELLDKLTDQKPGKWTWPIAGLLYLQSKGFEIKICDPFDYEKFANDGEKYLSEFFGEAVAKEQIKHSQDMSIITRQTRELLKSGIEILQESSLDTAEDLIDKGFLLMFTLNSAALNQKEGYIGHFVVVYAIDKENVFLNDPGLPPLEGRVVPKALFEKAWETSRDMYAFRIKSV